MHRLENSGRALIITAARISGWKFFVMIDSGSFFNKVFSRGICARSKECLLKISQEVPFIRCPRFVSLFA